MFAPKLCSLKYIPDKFDQVKRCRGKTRLADDDSTCQQTAD